MSFGFGPKFIESLTKLLNNFYFKLIRTAQLNQNIFIRIIKNLLFILILTFVQKSLSKGSQLSVVGWGHGKVAWYYQSSTR